MLFNSMVPNFRCQKNSPGKNGCILYGDYAQNFNVLHSFSGILRVTVDTE